MSTVSAVVQLPKKDFTVLSLKYQPAKQIKLPICIVSAKWAGLHQKKKVVYRIYIKKCKWKFLYTLGAYSKTAAVSQKTFIDLIRFGSSPKSPVDISVQRTGAMNLIFHRGHPFQSCPRGCSHCPDLLLLSMQGRSLPLCLRRAWWTGSRFKIHPGNFQIICKAVIARLSHRAFLRFLTGCEGPRSAPVRFQGIPFIKAKTIFAWCVVPSGSSEGCGIPLLLGAEGDFSSPPATCVLCFHWWGFWSKSLVLLTTSKLA